MKRTDFLKHTKKFYDGPWYPLLVALLVLIGHSTDLEVIFGVVMFCTVMLGCFLCDDLRFAITPFLCTVFLVSTNDSPPNEADYSRYYQSKAVLITLIVTVVLLIASLTYFAVRHRHRAKRIRKKSIFWSMVIFCLAITFNGLFSANYTIGNLLYVSSFYLAMLLVYWLFAAYIRFDGKRVFDYFMYCLMLTGLLISAQLIIAYFTTIQFDAAGDIVKESVWLGWGVWTAIGGMLAMLMPACFYFAASHRHGWIGYLLGLLMYLCILLSQARGSLLMGSISLLFCLIVLCLYGKNRKLNRIFTLGLVLCGIIGCVVLWDVFASILKNFMKYGFGDNGRFDLWEKGIQNFKTYFVFGSGFYDAVIYKDGWTKAVYPYFYHNTLIQLLAATGLVGFGAYLYHRFCMLRLTFVRSNLCKIFLAIGIFSLLSISLLDVLFFNTYSSIFYALMLLFMDKSEDEIEMEPCFVKKEKTS